MADFSALKAAIQAAIRQNGNNEITGNIMQGILLSMVNTIGDAAINALVDAVAALSARVADGYMYAGIATPTSTPTASSGKVFYIAMQAGTYTNYGSLVVEQGINIIKTDNSSWTLEVVWNVDDTPKAGSKNLVESDALCKLLIGIDFTEITGKYITPYGEIADSAAGFYSTPIFVREGETITYSIEGFGCAILSLYNNGSYTPIVVAPSSLTQYTNETFTANENCYVVFCGTPGTLTVTSNVSRIDILEEKYESVSEKYESVSEEVGKLFKEIYGVGFIPVNGKYITPYGEIADSAAGFYTEPIPLKAGETLTYAIEGFGCAILSLYDNGTYTPIVVAPSSLTQYVDETYTAAEDCYVVFCGTPGTLSVSSSISRIDSLQGVKTQVNELFKEIYGVGFIPVNGKYITPYGEIADSAAGFYTEPIPLKAGETLTYSIHGIACAILSLYDNGVYTPVVVAPDYPGRTYLNVTYTAVGDCFVVFSGTPGTLQVSSTMSRIDSIEERLKKDTTNSDFYETIRAGIITNEGQINYGSLSCVLFFIPGGHGFYLELNSGYVVQSSHLYDEATRRRLQSNFVGSGTWIPLSFGGRTVYGQDTTICGQFIAVVIKKDNNNPFDENELETVIKRYCRLDNTHLHRWVIEQPYFFYAQKRMRAISNLQWLCREKVQAVTSSYNSVRFLQGETYNGVPYSDVSEKNKYVGVYVTPYTFLTAASNKRSLVYTENLAAKTSGYGIIYDSIVSVVGCYYGSVCSGLTAAVMGLPIVYLVSDYQQGGKVPNLTTIQDAEDVRPLDLIYYGGHISIISDIYRDDYGNIKYILWAEYNYPNVFINVYTMDMFKERLTANSAQIRRYSAWGDTCTDITVPDEIPVDDFDYARTPMGDKDIHVFSGDKSCFSLDDAIYLNLNREHGYTNLLVYKNDSSTPLVSVDITQLPADGMYPNEDWVKYNLRQHELGYGKFKAVLYDGNNYSDYVYFEIVDTTATLDISGSVINSVSFTALNCEPVAVISSSKNYYANSVKLFTSAEIEAKTANLNWTIDSNNPYVTVLFRGEYGVAQKRVNTI